MCGICGWVDFQRDLTDEHETLDAMCETMACRGPDAAGTRTRPRVALGHRRLAIIDLPGGAQPMELATPDGPISIVYSGETYNFTELRRELRGRGHRFDTESDTEVVLHGYLEWGPGVAERLNGMYAFAIWDSRVNQLVLVRDRMGINRCTTTRRRTVSCSDRNPKRSWPTHWPNGSSTARGCARYSG